MMMHGLANVKGYLLSLCTDLSSDFHMLPVFLHHTEWTCGTAVYIEAALSWAVDALQTDCDQPNLQHNTDPHVKIFCSVNTSTPLIRL
jgi:hypothetical protein